MANSGLGAVVGEALHMQRFVALGQARIYDMHVLRPKFFPWHAFMCLQLHPRFLQRTQEVSAHVRPLCKVEAVRAAGMNWLRYTTAWMYHILRPEACCSSSLSERAKDAAILKHGNFVHGSSYEHA